MGVVAGSRKQKNLWHFVLCFYIVKNFAALQDLRVYREQYIKSIYNKTKHFSIQKEDQTSFWMVHLMLELINIVLEASN